ISNREWQERDESQPNRFSASGRCRTSTGFGSFPCPSRVRHKGLSAKGDRMCPAIAGTLKHCDHPTVHAHRRWGIGGGARSGRLRERIYNATGFDRVDYPKTLSRNEEWKHAKKAADSPSRYHGYVESWPLSRWSLLSFSAGSS